MLSIPYQKYVFFAISAQRSIAPSAIFLKDRIMVFFSLFSNNPNIVRIKAGERLFAEGDVGHLMFVLTIGTAETIVKNRVVETLSRGSIVGEMGIVSPGPRSASVVATSDCEFVAVDEKRFLFLVQQTPYFATQVMRVLADRLRAANELGAAIEDI